MDSQYHKCSLKQANLSRQHSLLRSTNLFNQTQVYYNVHLKGKNKEQIKQIKRFLI